MGPILEKFTSRKFLVTLLAQIAGLLILFLPEHTDQINQGVNTFGALALMVLSAIGYLKAEGAVDAAKAKASGVVGAAEADSDKPPSVTEKPLNAVFVAEKPPGTFKTTSILLVLGLCFLMAGCAYTPTKRWAAAREGLTAATQTLSSLATQDILSDKEIVMANKLVQSARAALEAAETQLPAGGKTFDDYLDIVGAIVQRLQHIQGKPLSMEDTHGLRLCLDARGSGQGDHRRDYQSGRAGPAEGGGYPRTVGGDQGQGERDGRGMGWDRRGGPSPAGGGGGYVPGWRLAS